MAQIRTENAQLINSHPCSCTWECSTVRESLERTGGGAPDNLQTFKYHLKEQNTCVHAHAHDHINTYIHELVRTHSQHFPSSRLHICVCLAHKPSHLRCFDPPILCTSTSSDLSTCVFLNLKSHGKIAISRQQRLSPASHNLEQSSDQRVQVQGCVTVSCEFIRKLRSYVYSV